MTKDDIIRMVKEAGYKDLPAVRLAYQGFNAEHFAALVAAAEREACAMLCQERADGWLLVKIVHDDVAGCMNASAKHEARALSEAIRARSQS